MSAISPSTVPKTIQRQERGEHLESSTVKTTVKVDGLVFDESLNIWSFLQKFLVCAKLIEVPLRDLVQLMFCSRRVTGLKGTLNAGSCFPSSCTVSASTLIQPLTFKLDPNPSNITSAETVKSPWTWTTPLLGGTSTIKGSSFDPSVTQTPEAHLQPTGGFGQGAAVTNRYSRRVLETRVMTSSGRETSDRIAVVGVVDMPCTIGYHCVWLMGLLVGQYRMSLFGGWDSESESGTVGTKSFMPSMGMVAW